MDLQSILNASDSDDDDPVVAAVKGRGIGRSRLQPEHFGDGGGNNEDLEQILRDDDYDDDDDDDNDDAQRYHSAHNNGHHQQPNVHSWNHNNGHHDTSTDPYSTAHLKVTYNSSNLSSHTAEERALLQALLGEDQDENDDDDDWIQANSSSNGGSSSPPFAFKKDVDAILLSDNDDDDDDDDEGHLSAISGLSPLPVSMYNNNLPPRDIDLPQRRTKADCDTGETKSQKSDNDLLQDPAAGKDQSSRIYINMTSTSKTDYLPPSVRDNVAPILASSKPSTTVTTSFVSSPSSNINKSCDVELKEEAASERAMAHAQAYERKLLKSGHREIVSPLMVKRRLKQKIELGTRMQQKGHPPADRLLTAATHRFGFSGVVENRTMKGISAGIRAENLRPKGGVKVDLGLPTALAVNSKFIAVGTQRGLILVFDLFEVLKQILNAANSDEMWNPKYAGSITSIDLNMNDEILVAGYTSGYLVLWDTIKGVMLRTVTETHPSPITSVRFLSDLKMVSVDAGGLVNKLSFSKTMLWSTYSMDTECLLDGTAGQILAMNVLPPLSTVNPQLLPESAHLLRRLVLIALSSERSSFAVAVEPTVNVLHRWARPAQDRIDALRRSSSEPVSDQTFLPCLSWGWALISGGGNMVAPILARAWGCCVQLLLASFPTADDGPGNESVGGAVGDKQGNQPIHWPAFGLHGEFDVDDPVVALEWLNDRSLVYLTVTSEFTVVDTVMMTLLERLDFSGLRLVYAEFSLSRSSDKSENPFGDNATYCSTFQNSIRSSDQRLLVLCQEELKFISIVGAKRRISALEEDGEWLEALAVALDHFENTVHSQEDRRRDPNGKRDLSRHPEFLSAKSDDEEWISKLLIRYLNLAVDNAPESPLDEHGLLSLDGSQAIIDLAQSHFQMLAGVCVEFCVVTRRLDLLFGPIFRRFRSVGFTSVFLDVLEPYVLNDKLSYIAPEAMTYFVDHCKATNGIATVERCLLHMDVRIMDFDSILSLLRKNEMYSALFYVFNQGLDDYITPMEILLDNLFDAADIGNAISSRRQDGIPQNNFERLGYKALLYLKTCFRGKTFPKETELVSSEERLPLLRAELLSFLLREQYTPSPYRKNTDIFGHRAFRYPYTHLLLMVDARVMLDALALALDAPDGLFVQNETNMESVADWEVELTGDLSASRARATRSSTQASINGVTSAPDMQQIISMLSGIILPDLMNNPSSKTKVYKSKCAVNAFLDFLARYLMKGVVRVNKSITFKILTRMAERFSAAKEPSARQLAQRQILDLLTALPRNCYDPEEVLKLVDRSGIHRAALLLHQEGASWNERSNDPERRAQHFSKAIDCYLDDVDPTFRKEVFFYVKKECSGVSESSDALRDGGVSNNLRDSLSDRLPELVHLDALMTAELVAELFVDDLHRVVTLMDQADSGESQFMFFQAIVSGELNEINPVAGAVLNANLTMEHHHKYLALMAKLHPDMVYEYLSTHDNYRPEECLQLCQDHNIADASAYLLERMGHVSSALQLILQTLESRMMSLKRTVRGMGLDRNYSANNFFTGRKPGGSSFMNSFTGKQEKDVEGVKRLLIVALDLCERNSKTFSAKSEHGSQLWFNVLDRLINAKGFLRLAKEQPAHANIMAGVLSELLRLTMQRMVSSVPLTDLVRKVTSDHSGSRLGELREMIDSLLSTYGFELNVFSGAVKVFHHDVQSMHREQRDLRLEGAGVSRVMQFPLIRDDDDFVNGIGQDSASAAYLERTSRSGCTLRLGEGGHAALLADSGSSVEEMSRNESGLANAMARLRSRRATKTETKVQDRSRAAGLNFMTLTDQEVAADEHYGDSFAGDHLVGQLGEAEHRGRLMTFM